MVMLWQFLMAILNVQGAMIGNTVRRLLLLPHLSPSCRLQALKRVEGDRVVEKTPASKKKKSS